MKKQFILSIPTPCHEKASSFTPTSKGAFCASCQKEVIDFTSWSDERIVRHFAAGTKGCGRFRGDQLRTYELSKPKRSRLQMFASVVVVTVLSFFWQRPSFAQSKDKQIALTEQHVGDTVAVMGKPSMPVSFTVSGIVRAEDGSVMPGVNIVRKGTSEGTVSNEFGEFKLTLTNPFGNDTLMFSFIGMVSTELHVSARKDETLAVTMRNDIQGLLGETMIVGAFIRSPLPVRLWTKLKNLLTAKPKSSNEQTPPAIAATSIEAQEKDKVVESDHRSAVCYPNPVTDKITVSLPGPATERFVSICSLQGQVIEERISTKSEEVFDVSAQPAGIYILKIEGVGESRWVRVVKK